MDRPVKHNQFESMFSNIIGSIDLVSQRLQEIDTANDGNFNTNSILEEAQRLKSIKMTPVKANNSFTDFQNEIKESW